MMIDRTEKPKNKLQNTQSDTTNLDVSSDQDTPARYPNSLF